MTVTVPTLEERATLCQNPMAEAVFSLMARKQSNLAVSVDVEHKNQVLDITDRIGEHVCMIKLHLEYMADFDWDLITQLQTLAKRDDFLIVSDSKIGDIGNTAKNLYTKGRLRISEWADFVTVHPVPGPGVIEALREGMCQQARGILLVAQMSSAGTLAKDDYTKQSVAMAEAYPDCVAGFVCQERLTHDPRFLHFTPGVSLEVSADDLGQRFRHPRNLTRNFADIIAVGRGVYQAENPTLAAAQYREEGWQGYLER